MTLIDDLQNAAKSAECAPFRGGISSLGFGVMGYNGRPVYAHAVSWDLHNLFGEPVTTGILQTCGLLTCVNPAHLIVADAQLPIRERHLMLTLPDHAVRAIFEDDRKQKDIAAEYWIKPLMVRRIKHGKSFKWLDLLGESL